MFDLCFSAQNIHTETDWDIVFTLLQCVGAGAIPPEFDDAILVAGKIISESKHVIKIIQSSILLLLSVFRYEIRWCVE